MDGSDDVFVMDIEDHKIRRIDSEGVIRAIVATGKRVSQPPPSSAVGA